MAPAEVNFKRDMAARAGYGDTVAMLQEPVSHRPAAAGRRSRTPWELADAMAVMRAQGTRSRTIEGLESVSGTQRCSMQLGDDFDATVAHMEFLASEVL